METHFANNVNFGSSVHSLFNNECIIGYRLDEDNFRSFWPSTWQCSKWRYVFYIKIACFVCMYINTFLNLRWRKWQWWWWGSSWKWNTIRNFARRFEWWGLLDWWKCFHSGVEWKSISQFWQYSEILCIRPPTPRDFYIHDGCRWTTAKSSPAKSFF